MREGWGGGVKGGYHHLASTLQPWHSVSLFGTGASCRHVRAFSAFIYNSLSPLHLLVFYVDKQPQLSLVDDHDACNRYVERGHAD